MCNLSVECHSTAVAQFLSPVLYCCCSKAGVVSVIAAVRVFRLMIALITLKLVTQGASTVPKATVPF
jgi:hypothetical protein